MLLENIISNHIVFDEKFPLRSEMEEIRNQNVKIFEQNGFPSKRNEEWKYNSIQPLLNEKYSLINNQEISINYDDIRKYFINDIDTYKLVFINGKFNSFLSETTHEEADVCILSSVLEKEKYETIISKYLNKSPNANDAFFALNTAFLKEGAYIFVPKNKAVSKPIQIMYFSVGNEIQPLIQTRNLIVLEEGAEIQIIERHQNIGTTNVFTNSVTEIFAGKNSTVDYYKVQNDILTSNLIDTTTVSQEKDSTVSIHTFSIGGNLTRNNLNFYQNGENCNSILKGITLINENQEVDHHTLISHLSPNCESHELYRGIFMDKSHGIFNGKVLVDKKAQKINAYQQNNNILLSDDATIDTKPQLEIFADDVKCSHGCTVGQMDDEALFYLRSRGIPLKEAEALLTYAFSADVLETVKIPSLKSKINKLIAHKLQVDFAENF